MTWPNQITWFRKTTIPIPFVNAWRFSVHFQNYCWHTHFPIPLLFGLYMPIMVFNLDHKTNNATWCLCGVRCLTFITICAEYVCFLLFLSPSLPSCHVCTEYFVEKHMGWVVLWKSIKTSFVWTLLRTMPKMLHFYIGFVHTLPHNEQHLPRHFCLGPLPDRWRAAAPKKSAYVEQHKS